MFKIIFFSLLFFTASTNASPFLDLGLGYGVDVDATKGKSCMLDWKKDSQSWGCSEGVLGYAAVGYEYKNLSIAYEHWSSIREYDAGMDIVSIKYRFKP